MDKTSSAYKKAKREADKTYEKHSAYKSMYISKLYKEYGDDLVDKIEVIAITTPPLFAGLKTALWAVAYAPLCPHPWSPRASLVFSMLAIPKQSWTLVMSGGAVVFLSALLKGARFVVLEG